MSICLQLCRLLALCAMALSVQPAQAQQPVRFDAQRAYAYLGEICRIGPRISGSPGMQQQQTLLENHFTRLGGEVRFQEFDAPHPQTGQPVRMKNLIVHWQPQSSRRLLLCCHYDTRPFPDRETSPVLRQKPFLGANDGASGVALLMELGHQIAAIQAQARLSDWGVDFVFFDAEELVFAQGDKYFLGSEYFAQSYREHPPAAFRYEQGVLLDMVAGADASFHFEVNSLKYAPEVTRSIWNVAAQLGIRDFVPRRKHEVLDDHLALNKIAGIPTCDIIDFDYPHWHRRNDLPAACSPQTLGMVGQVMIGWLLLDRNTSH